MKKTVQTAIVGVTGYAGAELARLLLHHPRLHGKSPVFAGRVEGKDLERGGIPLAEIHPQLAGHDGSGNLKMEPFSWELLSARGVDVLFLATPHEQSREWVPEALRRGMRVIDLSGAWRLTDGGIGLLKKTGWPAQWRTRPWPGGSIAPSNPLPTAAANLAVIRKTPLFQNVMLMDGEFIVETEQTIGYIRLQPK